MIYKDKIMEILAKILDVPKEKLANYPSSEPLENLGLTSLLFIELIVCIEDNLGIEILDADLYLPHFRTKEDLFKTLEKYFPNNETNRVTKKVLICDCDNVLWRGIAGEEEIVVDEFHTSIQDEIVRLSECGVLICLASKSDRQTILEAFEYLPMHLTFDYITISKISKNDKATAIREIEDELGLSVDSFVFVDDSDYEIGLIETMIPQISTIKVNSNSTTLINEISSLFDGIPYTDINRTKLYREQKEREKDKKFYASVDEYNHSLNTVFKCHDAIQSDVARIVELSHRTNKFNLSAVRYLENDIKFMMSNSTYRILTFEAIDKYGDMGLIGTAVIRLCNNDAIIESFMLSCRVFGRAFEDLMISKIRTIVGDRNIFGVYIPTEKNKEYAHFYEQKGVILVDE